MVMSPTVVVAFTKKRRILHGPQTFFKVGSCVIQTFDASTTTTTWWSATVYLRIKDLVASLEGMASFDILGLLQELRKACTTLRIWSKCTRKSF